MIISEEKNSFNFYILLKIIIHFVIKLTVKIVWHLKKIKISDIYHPLSLNDVADKQQIPQLYSDTAYGVAKYHECRVMFNQMPLLFLFILYRLCSINLFVSERAVENVVRTCCFYIQVLCIFALFN